MRFGNNHEFQKNKFLKQEIDLLDMTQIHCTEQ